MDETNGCDWETDVGDSEDLAAEPIEREDEISNVASLPKQESSLCDDESFARRLQEEEQIQVGQDEDSEALARKLQAEEMAEQMADGADGKAGLKTEQEGETKGGKIRVAKVDQEVAEAKEDENLARDLQQFHIQEKMRVDEDAQVAEDASFAMRVQHEELSHFYDMVSKGDSKLKKDAAPRARVPGAVAADAPYQPPTSDTMMEEITNAEEVHPGRVGQNDEAEECEANLAGGSNGETRETFNVAVDIAADAASSRTSSSHPQDENAPVLEAWVAPAPPVFAQVTTIPSPQQDNVGLPTATLERRMKMIFGFFVLLSSGLCAFLVVSVLKKQNVDSSTASKDHALATTEWAGEDVSIVIQLDDKPEEVGWSLDCGTGPENVIQYDTGHYEGRHNELVFESETVSYSGEECTFTIFDSGGNGIKDGYFQIYHGRDTTNKDLIVVEGGIGWTDRATLTFKLQSGMPSSAPSSMPSQNEYQECTIDDNQPCPVADSVTSQETENSIPSPSSNPTQKPSQMPSGAPSLSPSDGPTSTPSMAPSLLPSEATEKPSTEPTNVPTSKPSNRPTLRPTFRPTFKPTKEPTNRPTFKPTQRPTPFPTLFPTKLPTRVPTRKPTYKPTAPCWDISIKVVTDLNTFNGPNGHIVTWHLSFDETGNILKSGGPLGSMKTYWYDVFCVVPGRYTFSITDSSGDGFTDDWEQNCGEDCGYSIWVGDFFVGGAFTFDYNKQFTFPVPYFGDEGCAGDFAFYLLTDGWPEETSWVVTDQSGKSVLQGGPYAMASAEYSHWSCLTPGDYEFTIYDKAGDGLQEPAIYCILWELDVESDDIGSCGSDFGSSVSVAFYVE